ncbi:MAG: MerR family transcriptional regulator [Chloroflexota bacterium]
MDNNGKLVHIDHFDDDTTFTTTEVADYLSKSPQTIRNWCDDVQGFMSIHASPNAGRNRTYTLTDIRILQYVKEEREKDQPIENIIASLNAMKQEDGALYGLPIMNPDEIKNKLAISDDTAKRLTISMLRTELDTRTRELEHLRDVEVDNARLEVRVEEKEKRIADLEESEASLQEKVDELNRQLLEVNRKLGEAYYKGRFDQATGVEPSDNS